MPAGRLSTRTLNGLRPGVATPSHDRTHLAPGIVHLGVGAFHRAHQAIMVDDCLNRGETGWGIVAASLRSPETRDALAPQDGLYTVATRGGGGTTHRVIGSIADLIVAPENPGALLAALTDPRIRLVTLTVTEKGYTTDIASGAVRFDEPDVQHDLAHAATPRTTLGFLTRAIAARRAAGTAPFTVLTCDNLPRNGQTLHRSLAAFADAVDPALGRFVRDEIACPSTMVDRIVPATTDADRAAVEAATGARDAWPVVCEPFIQWVIEDRFATPRPRLEDSGAEFVRSVEPFEHMKLRLLNGAHTTLAAVGRLAGKATVAEAIGDPAIRSLVEACWRQVRPTLAIDAAESGRYVERLIDRFSNPALPHRTAQIASDASLKVPQRLLAPLRDLLRTGAPADALIFAVAAFIRSSGGRDDAGRPFEMSDPALARWTAAPDQGAASASDVVSAFLGQTWIFGEDLPRHPVFASALTDAYAEITQHGVLAAIGRRIGARQS